MLAKLAHAHSRALDILLNLLDTTTDPKELRRICVAILNLKHPDAKGRSKSSHLTAAPEPADDVPPHRGENDSKSTQPPLPAARAVPTSCKPHSPVENIAPPTPPASPPHRVTESFPLHPFPTTIHLTHSTPVSRLLCAVGAPTALSPPPPPPLPPLTI